MFIYMCQSVVSMCRYQCKSREKHGNVQFSSRFFSKHKTSLSIVPFGFFTRHRIANIGIIANFVLWKLYRFFLLYFWNILLVNMKINIRGFNRITFQGCRLHWSSSFLMAKLKRSWQDWYSCIVESLWKTLVAHFRSFALGLMIYHKTLSDKILYMIVHTTKCVSDM